MATITAPVGARRTRSAVGVLSHLDLVLLALPIAISGLGLLMIYAERLFERFSFEVRVPRFLPVASAMAVSLAGLAIVLGALMQAGIV